MAYASFNNLNIPFKTILKDDPRFIEKHNENMKAIERWARRLSITKQDVFVYPGILFPQTGPVLDVEEDRLYTSLVMRLRVVGTSTTSAQLELNGSTFDTYSITSGVSRVVHPISFAVEAGDGISTELTVAGTDAHHLTVHLR